MSLSPLHPNTVPLEAPCQGGDFGGVFPPKYYLDMEKGVWYAILLGGKEANGTVVLTVLFLCIFLTKKYLTIYIYGVNMKMQDDLVLMF